MDALTQERFGLVPWREKHTRPVDAKPRRWTSTPEEQQRRRELLAAALGGDPDA